MECAVSAHYEIFWRDLKEAKGKSFRPFTAAAGFVFSRAINSISINPFIDYSSKEFLEPSLASIGAVRQLCAAQLQPFSAKSVSRNLSDVLNSIPVRSPVAK